MAVVSRRLRSALIAAPLSLLLLGGCANAADPLAEGSVPPVTVPTITESATASATPSRTIIKSPAADASTRPAAVKAPNLTTVDNFRDVAAKGLPLAAGGWMRTGQLYRSGLLNEASKADLRRLREAGVVLIIDLRTDTEVRRSPDRVPPGATREWVNLMNRNAVPPLANGVSATRARTRAYYADFVTDSAERARTKQVLKLILEADGPVLFHCTAGKDRTGWISALLQLTAGVDSEKVMREYLASNDYRAELIKQRYQETLAEDGRKAADSRLAADRLKPEYLEASLQAMKSRYGDVEDYLSQGLGLSAKQIKQLKAKLTA